MVLVENRVIEDSELRVTEAGEQRVTEGLTVVKKIIKYSMTGSSDVREKPIFSYEFVQKIFAIVE